MAPRPGILTFNDGALLLHLLRPDTSGLNEDAFAERHGALIADGKLTDQADLADKAEKEFQELFPLNKYSGAIAKKQEGDAKAQQEAVEEQLDNADLENRWSALSSEGNEIVSLEYRMRWLRQYGPDTNHNRRGLKQMTFFVAEKRKAFCESRREFIKRLGPSDYRTAATRYCERSAPTENLGTGEVELSKECRELFLNGCGGSK